MFKNTTKGEICKMLAEYVMEAKYENPKETSQAEAEFFLEKATRERYLKNLMSRTWFPHASGEPLDAIYTHVLRPFFKETYDKNGGEIIGVRLDIFELENHLIDLAMEYAQQNPGFKPLHDEKIFERFNDIVTNWPRFFPESKPELFKKSGHPWEQFKHNIVNDALTTASMRLADSHYYDNDFQ